MSGANGVPGGGCLGERGNNPTRLSFGQPPSRQRGRDKKTSFGWRGVARGVMAEILVSCRFHHHGRSWVVDLRAEQLLTFTDGEAISTSPGTSGLLALDWID